MDDAPRRLTVATAGCLPLAIGGFITCIGVWIVVQLLVHPESVRVNHRPGRTSDAWGVSAFVAVGLAIAGIRYRRVVDLDARTVETRYGWGPFTRLRLADVGEWRAIEIGREETRGSGSKRYTVVPVRLIGASATREIAAPRQVDRARALASTISRGAGVALRDGELPGAAIETPPDRVGEPLLPRLRDADLRADEPTPNRLRADEGIHGVRVRVPAAGVGCALTTALVPFAFFGGFWWFAWRPHLERDPRAARFFVFIPLLMGAIPFVIALVQSLRTGAFGYVVAADDSDGLRALGVRIGRDELTGLDVVDLGRRGFLRATTATRELKLAVGRTPAELAWLRATLLRALKG